MGLTFVGLSSLPSAFLAFTLMLVIAPAFGLDSTNPFPARTKALWVDYKKTFIQNDGRVIDKQQEDISHSESQGYGMLNAVLQNDRKAFKTIWRWTHDNLKVRGDNLLPWSWGKRRNGQWGIIDYNNATDGDVLVAYALIKAAKKWRVSEYRRQGKRIIKGIRRELAISYRGQAFLLPAYYGFNHEEGVVLNQSYAIFAAFRTFAEVDDRGFWDSIYRDSLNLISRSAFGKVQLPADWVVVRESEVEMWKERPAVFGYEAIRIFLYLSWEEKVLFPAGLDELFSFYEKEGYIPDRVNLLETQVVTNEAPAGFYAIYARVAEKLGRNDLSRQFWEKALQKTESEKSNYYSMSLLLLALNSG